ncbi:metabolite traffic protein EboE [Saccharomonospora viridis]|uniref:Xylose isomerase-like enzyme n=2 Tax=Saccharomonospora viridis TaxID=1852 RepID=C7MZ48_SACVD|nr:metabolite traffic protein EboE [Saccharomonospora viridis]ACU96169.1 xylose isomerase-like enzyme [Saccharomonospora viridis DSM 43017]KHF45326.1 xylose isomerase [Saccharomonospora viridis]SFP79220.1 Xylose isomerase-like TIM barrel [Saccharomonospora viridis]
MLSYCTNVHPAEDLDGIVEQLDTYATPVREALGVDVLGVGLWLAAEVASALASDPAARARLAGELKARGLGVQTLNAFPYGGFHDTVVKHSVYLPTWTDPRRARYTRDCLTVLADLLHEDADYGSISTLPLAWRKPWDAAEDDRATAMFAEVTEHARAVSRRLGKPLRLAVEPEPGCVLDTVADAVSWLSGRVDPEYVGLCLDTCHLAVSFAEPAEEVRRIHEAGLEVVKVQASAALHVDDPADPTARAALAEFVEPRYLHQVRERSASGEVLAADDLDLALEELPAEGPWRVHFHVPLHAQPTPPLRSTTDVLTDAITALTAERQAPHIEVETYTWSVLPHASQVDLAAGIADELRWARMEVAA